MRTPESDANGYPTEATLQAVSEWDLKRPGAVYRLLAFLREAWRYPDYFGEIEEVEDETSDRMVKRVSISTGGWSGNEDLIAAMQDNSMFWLTCWYSAKRGGHYVFEIHGALDTEEEA